jgi:hypothetical protein
MNPGCIELISEEVLPWVSDELQRYDEGEPAHKIGQALIANLTKAFTEAQKDWDSEYCRESRELYDDCTCGDCEEARLIADEDLNFRDHYENVREI